MVSKTKRFIRSKRNNKIIQLICTLVKKKAVICVAHLNAIPITEKELMSFGQGTFSIFYTVWSKEKGLGRKIIIDTWDLLKRQHTNNRYVTMSPKTEMAMKFHLRNGAILLQENPETNNFEYR